MSAITITEAQVLLFEALCLPKWSSLVVRSLSCSGMRPPRLHDKKARLCSPRIGQATRPRIYVLRIKRAVPTLQK